MFTISKISDWLENLPVLDDLCDVNFEVEFFKRLPKGAFRFFIEKGREHFLGNLSLGPSLKNFQKFFIPIMRTREIEKRLRLFIYFLNSPKRLICQIQGPLEFLGFFIPYQPTAQINGQILKILGAKRSVKGGA